MTRGFWYFLVRILLAFVYFSCVASEVPRLQRPTKLPTIRRSESCETSPVRQNVTLQGGIKAGYFHKLAQYVAMELCVQLCCQEKGCDVAFMIGKNCYGVKCFSEELCGVVPAKNAPKALMISKVDFRGEVYLQQFMPEKLKCFKTLVEENVTLNGGLTAGNFTAVGQAETIDACAKLCCVRDNCDLALLVNDHCFMVRCENEEQCNSTPIKNSNFITYIARVNRSKETAKDQSTVQALSSTPGKSSKLLCKNGVIQYNQTLLGGYDAGKFHVMALVTNMSTCIRLCCGEKTCDVAFMIENRCYAVSCGTLKLCRAIPAKNSAMLGHLNPRISYITSRNEEVNSVILRRHSEVCKSNVISYDVMLRGGRHAGKYKTFGEVDVMVDCIRICCMEKHCDVAFMISGICFTVKCHSEEACEEVRAPGSGFKPMLSYVVREKSSTRRGKAHVNRHQRMHKRVKGVYKVSKNPAMSIDVPHIPSPNLPSLDNEHYCTNSEIMYNVTLQGGIKAGKFRDRGLLPNMQECLRVCCIAKSCDLAFMLGNHCFSISCKTQALCEVVTARSSMYNPRVAYIYARSKDADRSSKPGNSSTARTGHSRDKSPVVKITKSRISSSVQRPKFSITTNSKSHTGSHISRNHKNSSRMTYRKGKILSKKLSLNKTKLDYIKNNKHHQNPKHFTDTILLKALEDATIPSNSTNATPLVAFYKNRAGVSNKNSRPGASASISDHTISTTLNTTREEKFSKNASLEMGNITSTVVNKDNQTSEKDFQAVTSDVATGLRPNSRGGVNFKDFLRNVTLLQTPKHEHSTVQKTIGKTDATDQDLEEPRLFRPANRENRTLVNEIEALSGMIKPFPGNNKENERPKNQTASLEEMVSETSDSSSRQDSGTTMLATESSMNENPGNQMIVGHEIINETMDSSTNDDLSEKHFSINNTGRNQTSEHRIPPHGQRMTSEDSNGSLSSFKYLSRDIDENSMNVLTRKANTIDLMLLEAFSSQENSNSSTSSEENLESGLQGSNVFPAPTSAAHTKKEKSETNTHGDLWGEKENDINRTTARSDLSKIEITGRKSKHMAGKRTKSSGDRSIFLSKVFEPLSVTKNMRTLSINRSSTRAETAGRD